MSLTVFPFHLYPRIYKVSDLLDQQWGMLDESTNMKVRPPARASQHDSLKSQGAYLMDNGEHVVLYLCHKVEEEFI